MPLDTCITNVGEYFSSHYLDSTFAKDVKELVGKWNEQGSQSVPKRLASLSQHYFKAKTQALDEELPQDRIECGDEIRSWHSHLLQALGYQDLQPFDHPVEGAETFVPAVHRVNRYNRPWLVICETHFSLPDSSLKEGQPSEEPLGQFPEGKFQAAQFPEGKFPVSSESQGGLSPLETGNRKLDTSSSSLETGNSKLETRKASLCAGDWTRCIGRLFTDEDGPRWVLFLAGSQILLLDRNTFAQGRYLAFDIDDALGRKEKDTFNHIAAFLSAETLCPGGESDEVLLEKLEEQSHKFAHGVTESLQGAVREAIELLINDWARDRVQNQKLPLMRLTEKEVSSMQFPVSGKSSGNNGSLETGNWKQETPEITAEHLRREALAFVYRLLFCFYAEARGGELEILPIDQDSYRLGYSLESLRDLEQVPLTAATENGTYFHEHLKQLFQLIHSGFTPQVQSSQQKTLEFESTRFCTFNVRPLTATLFSPDTTPLLNRAKLSNRCLQQVIRNLSLSKDDKSRTIGRVNYAELGINQLGAVYEGLLSYKGMFADQDLIHVKPADKAFGDKKTSTWFVPKDRHDEFKKDEVERLPDGKPRIYVKGTFILHLNGIDREQSASYYTPEVLTKCLVEEALRELLKDYTPADADRILELKICEPAMGSGAFLNEAARQLAERYLELKQKQLQEQFPDGEFPVSSIALLNGKPLLETGNRQLQTSIEPSRYADELRRVQHYIATRNIYGVDLNATAVELGALSLWLGSIHRLLLHRSETGGRDTYQAGATPWFGLRLRCGNSLIGARRAVWTIDQLKRGEHSWTAAKAREVSSLQSSVSSQSLPAAAATAPLETGNSKPETLFSKDRPREIIPGIPRLLRPGEERREDEIYHFLVFDPDMVPTHSDQLMKSFWPDNCAAAKKWITQQVNPKWTKEQTIEAQKICDLIDQRWDDYSKRRQAALDRTSCTATVWPVPSYCPAAVNAGPTLAEQEQVKAELESTSGSFQRIKLVMDAWCAFWFWPLENVTDLPSRDGFLTSARLLLGAEAPKDKLTLMMMSDRLGFDIEGLLAALGEGQVPDTDILSANVPWFAVARTVSGEQNFHHWELVFSEILGVRTQANGFDLLLGNPPWVGGDWEHGVALSEINPTLGVAGLSSADFSAQSDIVLDTEANRREYSRLLRDASGQSGYLSSEKLYPILGRMRTNLYKNFICRSWDLVSENAAIGFLHPESVYDEPKGGAFRIQYYRRLVGHFQFKNELLLFADVGNRMAFSINVARSTPEDPSICHIGNLYHPKTIAACLTHSDRAVPTPAIKTEDDNWDLRGHFNRIVPISGTELSLFSRLNEESDGEPDSARLPQLHSIEQLRVLQKFDLLKHRLGDETTEYFVTPSTFINETNGQRDGLISNQSNPSFEPKTPSDWVVCGPHFFVGTPMAKSAMTNCNTQRAYNDVDLLTIDESFLPRSQYRIGDVRGSRDLFERGIPIWPQDSGIPITQRFRHCNRIMVQSANERTLISSIIPPGAVHTNGVLSVAMDDLPRMIRFHSCTLSVVFDFLIKLSGRTNCRHDTVSRFPILDDSPLTRALCDRTLRLSCLTRAYEVLWAAVASPNIARDCWGTLDHRIKHDAESPWLDLDPQHWFLNTPLRSQFSRRQALLEIDVLVAQALRLDLSELIAIYRVQFPVMRMYDAADEFDALGDHIPNTTRKNQGGTEFRTAREEALKSHPEAYKARPATDALSEHWPFPDEIGNAPPLEATWEIDNGFQTVTKLFYPPFTKVDRESDYARAWEVFEQRYGKDKTT